MAKKPTGGLTRGKKKKINSKNGKKNILDDLPGVKRRKIQEKMAKNPTGGLSRGKKKQVKSNTGGLLKDEKKKIMSENGKKNIPGGEEPEIPINRIWDSVPPL